MDEAESEFMAFMRQKLEELGIDGDVYAEYVLGIVKDDSLDDDEKLEAVQGSLLAVLEDDSKEALLHSIARDAFDRWRDLDAKQRAKATETKHSRLVDAIKASSAAEGEDRQQSSNGRRGDEDGGHGGGEIDDEDEEERRLKKSVMEQYGMEVSERVERGENGEIYTTQGLTRRGENAGDDGLLRNDNKERVKAVEQMQRDAAKQAHEKEQGRIREQKAREEAKKAKEAQRVAKKERRAGR
ncbi:unnamed protein product [Vitrella brassicaformis CCMP3155]|uniref:CCDC43 PWI-like domain-containing protein n=2 Tax=Vitrella brassicaformis TaxID=1169539 RepID=A0A0G4EM85_VITBC|nr:unnamed protein product [Vitrella brassicaformis CCMP3155]|eukprot:CEL97978.1 unnamed protein product [Vitrella brassicaformis CCMP3155]